MLPREPELFTMSFNPFSIHAVNNLGLFTRRTLNEGLHKESNNLPAISKPYFAINLDILRVWRL